MRLVADRCPQLGDSRRAILTAKRELLVEAVRAWAATIDDPGRDDGTTIDLLAAWREFAAAERKV